MVADGRRLAGWVRSHPRGRMLVYNQGENPAGPFRLKRLPRAERVLRGAFDSSRFAAVPAEFGGT